MSAPKVGDRVEFCIGKQRRALVWRPAVVTAYQPGVPAVEGKPAVQQAVVRVFPQVVRRTVSRTEVIDGRDVLVETDVEEPSTVEVQEVIEVEPAVEARPAVPERWTLDVTLRTERDRPSRPARVERRKDPVTGKKETVVLEEAVPFRRGDNDFDLVNHPPADGVLRGITATRIAEDVGCIKP